MPKQIVAYQVGQRAWKIKVDGKNKCIDFVSASDVCEWLGNLQSHGLYKGYSLFARTDTGAMHLLTPVNEHPCEVPAIAR